MWEKDSLTPGLDVEHDRRIPVPFEEKNMPQGGEPVTPLYRNSGSEDEDLQVVKANWARGHRAEGDLLTDRSSIHEDV
jgi:hypothetical protein